jgi:protein-tyrosine phosphatase
MAHGLFQSMLEKEGLDNSVYVDSAGTGNWHQGENSDPRTLRTLQDKGIPFSHASRQIQGEDLLVYDYIVAMDSSNFYDVNRLKLLVPDSKAEIIMLRDFDPKGKGDVPDPYYDREEGFEKVFQILERSLDKFLDHLKEEKI